MDSFSKLNKLLTKQKNGIVIVNSNMRVNSDLGKRTTIIVIEGLFIKTIML